MDINKVDTRHGSFNYRDFSNGNTLPYTGAPFGMNYFAVQNQKDTEWFFNPKIPLFQGIRLTHQPSPWMGDFSSILFTPITGSPKNFDVELNQSSYDINHAIFKPHYLSLELLRYRLNVEVAPTTRGVKFRLTNHHNKNLGLLVQTKIESEVQIDYDARKIFVVVPQTVNNGNSTLYFYTVIDFSDYEIELYELTSLGDLFRLDKGNKLHKGNSFYIKYQTLDNTNEISIGTSFISQEYAVQNMEREVSIYSFDQIVEENEKKWNYLLNKIEVKDRDSSKVEEFNQYLYRVFLFPQTFYEYDNEGLPVHFNIYDDSVRKGKFFTNIGFWDAYKTIFPLYSIILPEFYKSVLEGIEHFYEYTSHLPKWLSPDERGTMPGTQVSAVIADGAVKGLASSRQMKIFLDAMIKEATIQSKESHFGRRGISDTKKYGYVTTEEEGSVNQTQDNAYSDFCIRQVANLLGESNIAKKYEESSLNYRNLFDRSTGFMRGRDKNGQFVEPFLPEDWSREYVEASPWVNSLGVFHNFADYIELLGGGNEFEKHLVRLANSDSIFELSKDEMEYNEVTEVALGGFGQIAISNQPGFHIPYLYSYVGKPEYTQVLVKQLCEQLFNVDFEGYPGDEDNGSLSGWYIFSSIGFYPVTPGTNQYVIGIPQFEEVVLNLPNNDTFTIQTSDRLPQNQFIKSKKLNEVTLDKLFLTHEEILQGGILKVKLSVLPVEKEYPVEYLPYSLNNDISK